MSTHLQATPIDVSSILAARLFEKLDCVILASATLAVSGEFEFVQKRLRAELGAAGLRDFPELRGSHRRILQMIPAGGIRITDLARMAGMTKQSLGEFVDWLERRGFVTSGRDPADGRVRLVTRTADGDCGDICGYRDT